jgi:tetratricopeptide (TPR) repeat protein
MIRNQWLLLIGALALTLLLYKLPRNVVENERVMAESTSAHPFDFPADIQALVARWRRNWSSEPFPEKKINFADSLARVYLDYQRLDSAVWFADFIHATGGNKENHRAARLYYGAFQRAGTADESKIFGAKARGVLERLVAENPKDLTLKNQLAMTLVSTETPMAGIQMLQAILTENPEHRETLSNLGILAIQSGQFDKAEHRFRKLVELDPTDPVSRLYLGVSLLEQGKAEGRPWLEALVGENVDPAVTQLAKEYLEKN